ncbi:hypothetical protein [Thomasclavelia sp.]|uniref:hypothetical protein n=1 Tax=Thomasclavelia sp. TaxID=3025757 RepID=UPI0025CC3A28|nr:hypothetical protein [Thomasclavelia sp.]
MNNLEKISLFLISIGIIIMSIACMDIISILASFFNNFYGYNLPDTYFNSFIFRTVLTLLGGIFLLIGGLFLKKDRS